MAAAMNGIFLAWRLRAGRRHLPVLHRLCAARDADRGADGHAGVIYVMTHDSIGLGEDGPTHQPVEHLAALRAMPNMRVFRPCDAVETAECWQLALEPHQRPDRAGAVAAEPAASAHHRRRPTIPAPKAPMSWSPPKGEAKVSLFASGSEVEIAVAAQKQLAERGIATRVVSVPSLELLLAQPADTPQGDHRRRPGQDRDRGRGAVRLGRGDRPGWRFRRHEQLRRQRPGQGPLQALRHHRRGRG